MSIFKDFGVNYSSIILPPCLFPTQPGCLIFNRDSNVFRKILKAYLIFHLVRNISQGFVGVFFPSFAI